MIFCCITPTFPLPPGEGQGEGFGSCTISLRGNALTPLRKATWGEPVLRAPSPEGRGGAIIWLFEHLAQHDPGGRLLQQVVGDSRDRLALVLSLDVREEPEEL